MLTRITPRVLFALTSGLTIMGADFAMKVTDKNYLDTQGFSVFLYDSTYHPVFVDQKNTAMEMIDLALMFWGKRDQLMSYLYKLDWIVRIISKPC